MKYYLNCYFIFLYNNAVIVLCITQNYKSHLYLYSEIIGVATWENLFFVWQTEYLSIFLDPDKQKSLEGFYHRQCFIS